MVAAPDGALNSAELRIGHCSGRLERLGDAGGVLAPRCCEEGLTAATAFDVAGELPHELARMQLLAFHQSFRHQAGDRRLALAASKNRKERRVLTFQ